MKTKSSVVLAAVIGALMFAPAESDAQGPPPWVRDRIMTERGGDQEIDGRGGRRGPLDVARRRAASGVLNACAPGLNVAMQTPAGPILAAIFGVGGIAAHARPGCRDAEGDGEWEERAEEQRRRDSRRTPRGSRGW